MPASRVLLDVRESAPVGSPAIVTEVAQCCVGVRDVGGAARVTFVGRIIIIIVVSFGVLSEMKVEALTIQGLERVKRLIGAA